MKKQVINFKLKTTIEKLLKKGKTKEEIFLFLLSKGFKVDEIFKNYNLIGKRIQGKPFYYKKLIKVLLFVGGLLFSFGVFSFIASNWLGFQNWLKLFIFLIFMLNFYSIGFYLFYIKKYYLSGDVLIFLGSVMYAACIFFILDIYDLNFGFSFLLSCWIFGVLLLLFVHRSFLSLSLFLIFSFINSFILFFNLSDVVFKDESLVLYFVILFLISVLFFILQKTSANQFVSFNLKQQTGFLNKLLIKVKNSFIKNLSIIFYIFSLLYLFFSLYSLNKFLFNFEWYIFVFWFSVISILMSYLLKSEYFLFLGLFCFLIWLAAKVNSFDLIYKQKWAILYVLFLILGFNNFLLGFIHRGLDSLKFLFGRFFAVYNFFAVILVSIGFFYLSSKFGLKLMDDIDLINILLNNNFLLFVFGFFTILFLLLFIYGTLTKKLFLYEILSLSFMFIVYLFVIFFQKDFSLFKHNKFYPYLLTNTGKVFVLFFNIILFLYSILVIFIGFFRKSIFNINFGLIFLCFIVIVKYFDLLFNYLDKSIFFLSLGLFLLLLGIFLERARRFLLFKVKR